MRRVREACAVEARGGAERIISDVLLAEHKQWIARLEKEGSQFLPSPEEEEELLREMQLSVGRKQHKTVGAVPNLSPHVNSGDGSGYEDQMMLEEYLEAEAHQVEQYEHSLEQYLAQGEDTPMTE